MIDAHIQNIIELIEDGCLDEAIEELHRLDGKYKRLEAMLDSEIARVEK